MSKRWAKYANGMLHHPIPTLLSLLGIAAGMEFAHYLPELVPGTHALGEVIRNSSYALFTALLFHWLVVEVPAQQRRRQTYDFTAETMRILITVGAGLLKPYQENAQLVGCELDVWSRASLSECADALNAAAPIFFGPDRRKMVGTIVDIALPRALAELAPSIPYMDPAVAHALSQIPKQDGLTSVLQVRPTANGGIEHRQDAHITWSLVEAARRLYAAILETDAYDPSIFQGFIETTKGTLPLTDDVLIKSSD